MADIELIRPLLGMAPFFLIEMRPASDGSGDPSLHIQFGGGVSRDEAFYLPLLAISESAPEGNPVAEMLRRVYRETGPNTSGSSAVENIVREFNSDWMSFVEAE